MTYLPATKKSDMFSVGGCRGHHKKLEKYNRLLPSYTVGHTKFADLAFVSGNEIDYTYTSSYLNTSGSTYTDLNVLHLVGGGTTGSMGTGISYSVTSAQTIDSLPIISCNSAKWMVFIYDNDNQKTSKVVSTWNNTQTNFYTTEVNQIGNVPVRLYTAISGSNVNLVADMPTGSWTIKIIKTTV